MAIDPGYTCSRCGEHHAELPMGYSTMAPDVWDASLESDPDSMLSSDQCIVRHEHYFIKGLIEIPVFGSEEPFSWGSGSRSAGRTSPAPSTCGRPRAASPSSRTSAG